MLVGREKELHLLHDIQNDDSSHFVAVYGRRRVGKTFLIREAFGYRFTFQHAGLSEGGMKEQIYAFMSSLKDAGYDVKKQPKNWLEAFEALKDVIRLSSEKKAATTLSRYGVECMAVPHPSMGGANRFRAAVAQLLGGEM